MKHHPTRTLGSAICALLFVGCAPTTNVAGVYFPAWLVSTVIGVFGAYATVLALGRSPRTRPLADSGLLFVALVAGISMASWLSLYSGF